MEFKILYNGIKMPMEGFGVFQVRDKEECKQSVLNAIRAGYRLIDTAASYTNEDAVGEAVREAIAEGICTREELFITSKMWVQDMQNYDMAAKAIDSSIKTLGVDYIDLLLIHQPAGNYQAGYQLMEKAYQAGKVKAIGLSNFNKEQIQEILDICEVKPAILQTEVHPYFQEKEMKAFLQKEGMVIQAWYPLGHGDKALIEEPVFTELAAKYGKSNAQVILRWHIQAGNIVIPGSKNPDHIRDNFALFDFMLTDEEMARVAAVDRNKRYYTSTPQMLESYVKMIPPVDEQK